MMIEILGVLLVTEIFIDFEFVEAGPEYPIIPLSVGLCSASGAEYYAEFNLSAEAALLANDWVRRNILPTLGKVPLKSRKQIADEIVNFCGNSPEFWGYYADYDWVLFCQLQGTMMDLKQEWNWPMYCRDLKQEMDRLTVSKDDLPPNPNAHHALADAKWNREVREYLRKIPVRYVRDDS
jgi:3' exoribonuclease, RNase T-like